MAAAFCVMHVHAIIVSVEPFSILDIETSTLVRCTTGLAWEGLQGKRNKRVEEYKIERRWSPCLIAGEVDKIPLVVGD